MPVRSNIVVVSRRTLLVSSAAAALFAPRLAAAATAGTDEKGRSAQFAAAFDRIAGGAMPIEGKITVDLPETAENGNFVPITIEVDSPMTEADHVRAIHILSTANPVAKIATFRLSPINAVARVQSRIRLARTQDVVVLAELARGDLLLSTTKINVTIGGCAG